MSSWNAGYVWDVPYIPGYYPEQSVEFIRFAQLLAGFRPSGLGSGARYLELGFGVGVSLNVLAAVHPEIEFWGNDFNPSQVLQAGEFGGGNVSNLTLLEDSFEEFAARDTPKFDFIALHGIWSWVSPENHSIILEILRRKLNLGGVVYLSYNAMPGWSVFAPLRALLAQHRDFLVPAGVPATAKAQDGLALIAELEKNQLPMLVSDRRLMDRVAHIRSSPLEYVVHEYLHEHHHAHYFSQVASAMAEAKLTFVGSSRPLNAIDGVNLSPAAQQHLKNIPSAIFREVLRDFYTSCSFRWDVFSRGSTRLSAEERTSRLDQVRLHLSSQPKDVPMKVTGALGEITLRDAIYLPLLEKLAAAGTDGVTFGELRTIGELKTMAPEAATEAACLLLALGVVFPVVDARSNSDPGIARALSRHLLRLCEETGNPRCIASPVARNGMAVDRIHASFMLGYMDGLRDKKALAQRAWKGLQQAGQRVSKDGKPLPTEPENLAELEPKASKFLADGRIALERIGVV